VKVLLANPPWKKGPGRYGVRAGSRWPFSIPVEEPKKLGYIPFPFFLAYAAALLEARSTATVLAVDAIAEGLSEEAYLARVAGFGPDLVVAEGAQASRQQDAYYARRTKALLPGVRYVLAGPLASVEPLSVLRQYPDMDFCLVGEYEWTLLDMVTALERGKFAPAAIAGLAWRDPGGTPVANARRPLGELAELPWPAYHHFPMLRYRDYFCGIPAPMVNMVASRGCPFRCSFCLWPTVMYGGHRYRARQPEDIVAEMEFLVEKYGFKTVYFDDDTFNVGKERIVALARSIRDRDLGVKLAIMGRADLMDAEILSALHAAGLVAVKYGLESASQQILDRCGKGLSLPAAIAAIRRTQELGIKVHLTFTVGLPGETRQTIEDSIRLLWDLDVESFQVSLATPFPGTPLYAAVREAGHLVATDAELYDGSCRCVARTDALSVEEIEAGFRQFQAVWKAHRRLREASACSK
jgi:anaerobic magnesium-protoporphyrin IX monomethyl ester cyclase